MVIINSLSLIYLVSYLNWQKASMLWFSAQLQKQQNIYKQNFFYEPVLIVLRNSDIWIKIQGPIL